MSIIPSFKMNAIDDVIFQGCLLFLNFSEKCLKLNHMLLLSFNTQYTLGIVHSGTNTRRGLRQGTSSGRIHSETNTRRSMLLAFGSRARFARGLRPLRGLRLQECQGNLE